MWSVADLADAVEAGVKASNSQLDEEHAVYGLDARDEVELHPILAQAFTCADYGVHREHRYPADQKKRKESEGERCDLVLTPDGLPLASSERKATLFEPADAVPLDEAYWLEVKTVAQYTIEGPNPQYSSQLLSTIRQDVTKLSKDQGILHAGLLIMMFVHDERVAEHDLGIWQDQCLTRGLPIAAPSFRSVKIKD
ncbi:MAG: hypothetical protein O7G85_03280, partial [Planctomycetota bacterium]|nr:hypothetical protein [Planctomycetota bacterium]